MRSTQAVAINANVYYFRHISKIGGIETFFYELAKKHSDIDLVILYKQADETQLRRLKKYVRCIQFTGQTIECEKAFFNFNLDVIDNIKAKEYCLVIHGDYKFLKDPPPQHEKITKVYGVSQTACDSYKELTGIDCELTYNPLEVVKPNKCIKLVSACRLGDKIKGAERTIKLANALDNYCLSHEVNYQWLIFADTEMEISPNVCFMKPRLDILPYMASADYVVQLSDNLEGYNYTVNESLSVGTPVVITPCDVYKELGINNTMSIALDFDSSNINEVVEKIFSSGFKFTYTPPVDNWAKILVNKKSDYKEELKKMVKVKALVDFTYGKFYKIQNYMPVGYTDGMIHQGDIFEVDKLEADYLCGDNTQSLKACEILEVIEEVKEKKTTRKKKAE